MITPNFQSKICIEIFYYQIRLKLLQNYDVAFMLSKLTISTLKTQIKITCQKGLHEKELRILKYHLNQHPTYYMNWYMLSCYYYQHKLISEAEKAIIKCLKLIPNPEKIHPFILYLMAEIQHDKGLLDDSLKYLNLASSSGLDKPILEHHLRGNIFGKLGLFSEALKEFLMAFVFADQNDVMKNLFSQKIKTVGNLLAKNIESMEDKEIALSSALECVTLKDPLLQQRFYKIVLNSALSLNLLDTAYSHGLTACQLFPKDKEFEDLLLAILLKRCKTHENSIEKIEINND